MSRTPANQQSKSVEKLIWQSAAPDLIKRAESTIRASPATQRYSGCRKSKQINSFLLRKTGNSAPRSTEKTLGESSLFYSIKYLGVTKGLIGILSKRSRIPQLSPLETCKNVPLARINSSVPYKISRINVQKHELNESIVNIPKLTKEVSCGERILNREDTQEFVIHTYARPRRLVSTQKSTQREDVIDSRNTALECKINSPGITGWKLIRPKTTTPEKQRSYQRMRKESKDNLQIDCKQIEIHTGYSEPYLKYLGEKTSRKKKGGVRYHS